MTPMNAKRGEQLRAIEMATARSIVRKEVAVISKLYASNPARFAALATTFYREHADFVMKRFFIGALAANLYVSARCQQLSKDLGRGTVSRFLSKLENDGFEDLLSAAAVDDQERPRSIKTGRARGFAGRISLELEGDGRSITGGAKEVDGKGLIKRLTHIEAT